jgi:hypothetical protein
MSTKEAQNKERLAQLDDALAKVKANQEESLVIDFDSAESTIADIEIRAFGKVFTTPSQPSAKVSMFLVRNTKQGVMSDEHTFELLEKIFGDGFLDAMADSNRPLADVVSGILTPVMEQWGFQGTKHVADDEKKV